MKTKRNRFRAEREFGLIVGGIFVLLSSWWIYRGKFHGIRDVTIVIGALLVVLGVLLPTALVYPNRIWMALAEALGFVTSRVVLTFVYFVVMTPIGVTKRVFGWDPLRRRAATSKSYWRPYSERQRNPRHYEKMF